MTIIVLAVAHVSRQIIGRNWPLTTKTQTQSWGPGAPLSDKGSLGSTSPYRATSLKTTLPELPASAASRAFSAWARESPGGGDSP